PIAVMNTEFDEDVEEAAEAKSLAMAMLAAFGGMIIGIVFLSWTYHYVLWIHFGLSGALYGVVKNLNPDFEVRLSWLEIMAIATVCALFVGGMGAYAIYKHAW